MKTYIKDVELALQALSLKSIEMIDRTPIHDILIEMYFALDNMQPSHERAVLRAFIDKLEEVLK